MVNSNARKLLLSGWLKKNGLPAYNSPLKLQKFLLFYEAFAKASNETADFSHLKGYKRGPVFSNVWGDYTYERTAFDKAAEAEYVTSHNTINEEFARKSHFLVSILSENELSMLTHKLNLWKAKENQIADGWYQVDLSESDFNDDDTRIIKSLMKMYPLSMIENSSIIGIDNHFFVFSKQDSERLSERHFDILCELAENENLQNPIYVELDENGRLIVD